MSLARDVGASLRGAGFEITRADAGSGRCRLVGVQGWCIWCDEVGSLESATRMMAEVKRTGQNDGERVAIVVRYKSRLRVLILHADIANAVQVIRMAGSNNRAAIASAARVLARAEEVVKTVSCGREKLRGCFLPLETWLDLLLAWRVAACVQRREVSPMPRAEGIRIGPRLVAYDYNAVRLVQVEREVNENLRRNGKTLWGSVMGASAGAGTAAASSMSAGREESEHGEGSGGEGSR